ncbi:MAG: altronate dehydratase family protein [Lachnospiraceae bacterium]|nr:altronate dehydratase family protein [Lachnospiraceae bacterium]
MRLVQIHADDTVAVNRETGHKVALQDIGEGQDVIKYGFPIGHATRPICKGEVVHVDNLKTNLKEQLSYEYRPDWQPLPEWDGGTIMAYERENGQVGIRNDVWIINTVGCVNSVAEEISRRTGAFCFSHPYGCSQLGEDHGITEKILRGLVHHPNAGGVLVLGLGCENNNIPQFQKILGSVDERRVKFLIAQECGDEIEEGVAIVRELQQYAEQSRRKEVSVSRLKVGLKCGGSDGFSGITANPLVGQFTDRLVAAGGSAVLTEVQEMFGA